MQSAIKQAQQAPKYILVTREFGMPLYIADTEKTGGVPVTGEPNQALQYSIGFDNPHVKIHYWAFATGYKGLVVELLQSTQS